MLAKRTYAQKVRHHFALIYKECTNSLLDVFQHIFLVSVSTTKLVAPSRSIPVQIDINISATVLSLDVYIAPK